MRGNRWFFEKFIEGLRRAVEEREKEGWIHAPEWWEAVSAFRLLKRAGYNPGRFLLAGINYRKNCIQFVGAYGALQMDFDGKIKDCASCGGCRHAL